MSEHTYTMTPELATQLDRAWDMAVDNYSLDGRTSTDADMLKCLLDRLEVTERTIGDAYDTIRNIDWNL